MAAMASSALGRDAARVAAATPAAWPTQAVARLTFVLTALAVIVAVVLAVSPVTAGSVACGKLAEYPTIEYVMREQPLPLALSDCGPALDNRAAAANVAQAVAAASLAIAIVLSLVSRPVQRLALTAAAARHRRRINKMHPGSDIEVDLPGDDNHRQIGTIIQTLDSDDEFDVSVAFHGAPMTIHPYRYSELKPA